MKKTLYLVTFLLIASVVQSNAQKLPIRIGVNTSMDNDSLLAATGYDYIEENTRKLFHMSDSAFAKNLAKLKKTRRPVKAANSFLPPGLMLIGPHVNEAWVVGYVDTVFRHAKQAGVNIIVLGSSASRRLPEGYDRNKAIEEFVYIGRKMAEVAKKHDITIAMESLNKTEDNFITTLAFANELATRINHKNFKLTADIYHMLMENESPESIINARKNLVHCHIAEKEGRAVPGTNQENFVPYFEALKEINYKGLLSIECRWKDLPTQALAAREYLVTQLNQAYNTKP
ncbi:sugar phosphate isomerase/epimerase [Chitinophaga horti]|uniref:Sugar phosphate isomerase/epimerase n=1 Tax=Chitinophaga horti TaxID=2920382 RepID=A0ABY6J2Y4_9BACT|nr:sugar phosphate isomerase/epimerase family protein [Chitinophaga horti]UYQ94002.1 sugar phosphate isomerase/epimerase [Chitinophaga horti]